MISWISRLVFFNPSSFLSWILDKYTALIIVIAVAIVLIHVCILRAVYRESHDNSPAGAMLFPQSISSSIGSYWKMPKLQTDSWVSRTSQAYDFGHKDVSSCYKHITKSYQRRTSEKNHFFGDFERPFDGRGSCSLQQYGGQIKVKSSCAHA